MRHRLKTRFASVFTRRRLEGELDRELSFHIDMLTQQNIRAGLAPAEARRLAIRHFGAVDGVKEAVRETWLSRAFETLGQDVRYGFRNIRRGPGFALVVVLTMALGIGANSAIFSVVNGVLLRPLPYANSDRLVVMRQERPLAGATDVPFSFKELEDYRQQAASLDGVAEFHEMWFILLGRPEPERVSTGVISANFFGLLGVKPILGRDFIPADERAGAPAVLMLSHHYWQRSLGGDPQVIGRVFQMNDRPHQVIGVLPPVPQYPSDVDVYMPTAACPFRSDQRTIDGREQRMMQAVARVRAGVTMDAVRADLGVVTARMQLDYPAHYPESLGFSASVLPLQEELTRSFRTTLLVLLGTAAFVLLIVCASIANLTLARMVRRQREMAVRAALGASRLRLMRQLLTESTILALLGGAAGLLLAIWGLDLLVAFAERFTARATEIRIDRVVLLYTLAISVATGLVFGSVPAFAGRFSPAPSLREGTRTTHASHTVRSGLIVVQVAVSFMLLVGAGLTIRTLFKLQQVDPGFRTDNIMTMRVDLNFTKYDDPIEDRAPFWERLDERLRAIPGALSVGGAGTFPLNDQGPFSRSLLIEGRELAPNALQPQADVRIVTPGYFSTLGQPVLEGRVFTPSDRGANVPVVIVSRTMAQHYWPGESAVGKRISGDEGRTWSTVVGVVADARQQLNRAPGDEIYVPMFQSGQLTSNWLVRSDLDPDAIAERIRAAVRAIDSEQPVDQFRTLAAVRLSSLESPKLTATLLGLFAGLALVITATGIAGVIAFSVNQRTQEFGVRMALGAGRANVLALVLRQGFQLVFLGLALGTAGALVLARLLTTLLFGVEPTDAVTFLAVATVLVAVALIACIIPARRAATVDPMVALRVG
jgi:putative ABC transport system permease protein